MRLSKAELASSWRTFEYIVVDIEGSGAQHKENEGIVEISLIVVSDGCVTQERFTKLINPEVKIPIFITKVHGIRNKDVESAPVFSQVKHDVEKMLGTRILVAHNAPVERRMFQLKMPEHGFPAIVDTMKMSKTLDLDVAKYDLDSIASYFDIPRKIEDSLSGHRRHRAYYDALLTAHLFVIMAHELLSPSGTLGELLEMCSIPCSPKEDDTRPPESDLQQNKSQMNLF